MATNGVETSDGAGTHRIVLRPTKFVMQLPVRFRSEFTRRHPYYPNFWRVARKSSLGADPRIQLMNEAARIILGGIGFTGEPVDPATSHESLGMDQLPTAWIDGAVAPLNLRGFVAVLLALPPSTRMEIGNFLAESALGSNDLPDRFKAQRRLAELVAPELDQYPDVAMISVNLHAADRTILSAVRALLKGWRPKFNVRATRRRDDRLEDYLRVWDLREGWTGAKYEVHGERRFHEIAREIKAPIRTVANRYASAFRIIVGHPYRPELWLHLFGLLKLSDLVGAGEFSRIAQRRPWRSKSLRPVPATVVQPERDENDATQLLHAAGVSSDEIATTDLLMDIESLIVKGRSDAQIMEDLELTADADVRLVAYIRDRVTERPTRDAKGGAVDR
jgi:hypothetical protein